MLRASQEMDDSEEERSELGKGTYAATVRMQGIEGTSLQGQYYAVKRMILKDLRKLGERNL